VALVAYQDRSSEGSDTLPGYLIPYFTISPRKPGAKVALVAYRTDHQKDRDTLPGYLIPYFTISPRKPGAKVALVAYQDRSSEGSGYLTRIPDTLLHHTSKNTWS
jgi:hypothetical protein